MASLAGIPAIAVAFRWATHWVLARKLPYALSAVLLADRAAVVARHDAQPSSPDAHCDPCALQAFGAALAGHHAGAAKLRHHRPAVRARDAPATANPTPVLLYYKRALAGLGAASEHHQRH